MTTPSGIIAWVVEVVQFLADFAGGKMQVTDARKRAKKLHDAKPATYTDELVAELDKRIAELELEAVAQPPAELPGEEG